MRKTIFGARILVPAACLGALLLSWWMYAALGKGQTPAAPSESTVGEPEPAAAKAAPAPEKAKPRPPSAREEVQSPPAEAPRPTANKEPGDGPTLRVRVVLDETGEAVAGAEVFHLDPTSSELRELSRDEQEQLMRDPIAAHVRLGKRLVTDAEGMVLLPDHSQKRASVAARKGDLVGMTGFEPEYPKKTGYWELRIGPRIRVRVEVVDHEGQLVVGIPVRVTGKVGGKRRRVLDLGRTDESGIAEANHALAMERPPGGGKTDRPVDTAVEVEIPGHDVVLAPIDLDAPPAEPVQLQIPATGSFEVRVVDKEGKWSPRTSAASLRLKLGSDPKQYTLRWSAPNRYTLRHLALDQQCVVSLASGLLTETIRVFGPTRPGQHVVALITPPPSGSVAVVLTDSSGRAIPIRERRSVRIGERGAHRSRAGRIDGEGRVVFQPVGLGKLFDVEHRGPPTEEKTIRGPRRRGEEVVVRFAITDDVIAISGRALDAEARPISGRVIRVRNEGKAKRAIGFAGARASATAHTSREGRFTAWLRIAANSQELAPLTIELLDRRDRLTGETVKTAAVLLAAGDLQLGDLTLAKPKLLLRAEVARAGQVHPDRLQFHIEQLQTYTVRGKAQQRWRRAPDIHRVARRDWHVEWRGTPTGGRYRLRVAGPGILPVPPIEFTPGTKDLTVHVARGGSLDATLRVDAAITPVTLWVALEQVRGERPDDAPSKFVVPGAGSVVQARGQGPTKPGKSLRYRWRALWPGTYRLLVRPLGTASPLQTIERLEVAAGKPTKDDRLDAIDIRGTTQLVKITLHDSTGKPPPGRPGQALLVRRGTDPLAFDSPAPDPQGRYLIARTTDPLRVVVCARGYRVMEVSDITKDTTVQLQPPHRVRVTLGDGGPTLPSGKTLHLSMHWSGGPPEDAVATSSRGPEKLRQFLSGFVGGVTVERGEAKLLVVQPGDYRPIASIRDSIDKRYRQTVELPESLKWSVRPVDGLQEFGLAIPQRLIDATLAR